MTPTAASPRVVLLSRPGVAQDTLQAALAEAGADLVLSADPTTLADAQTLQALAPDAVMVALEPAVEDVLERFDGVLGNPGVMVLYEEADLVAKREGWDAARWVRHLHAKLHGMDDVLPPPRASGEAASPDFDPVASGAMPEAPHVSLGLPEHVGAAGLDGFTGRQDDVTAQAHDDSARDQARRPVDFSNLQLEDPTDTAGGTADADEFVELAQRAHGLQLQGVEPPARTAQGAVLLLAGVGGPDAVRQVLAGLSPDFPRPVLILQRLDGGRHDKLVAQMARATAMPVQLAEAGADARAGHVYVLPHDVALDSSGGWVRFVAGQVDAREVVANLPASDSAVLVLSGGDVDAMDAVMTSAGHGALVAGQTPEGCYSPEAANHLVARGAESISPADMAHRLIARWPS